MSDQFIGKIFEGWILGVINSIGIDDLKDYIKTNEVPILFEYELPPYLAGVRSYVIENKETILSFINMEKVRELAPKYRPDLFAVIMSSDGQRWMARFLKMLRFVIENAELDAYQMRDKFIQRIKTNRAKRAQDNKLKRKIYDVDFDDSEIETPNLNDVEKQEPPNVSGKEPEITEEKVVTVAPELEVKKEKDFSGLSSMYDS